MNGSIRHDHAIHLWLGPALARLGYPGRSARGPGFRIAQMLGGHHGCFYPLKENEIRRPGRPELGAGAWEEQRQATLEVIRGIFEPPAPPQRMSIDAAAIICGIVILADWIVSQESFLLERLPHIPDSSLPDLLRAHHERTEKLVPALLDAAGLTRLRLRQGSFCDEFPFDPNPLQASVSETLPTLLGSGPTLFLVMAPMGEGKTETAFHAARLIGAAAGTPGLFVTLPTMATADQMYQRVRAYAAKRAETPAALILLHSMSWLNSTYIPEPTDSTPLTGEESGDSLSRLAATDWLRGRKRGLLAPLAVGTVDQGSRPGMRSTSHAGGVLPGHFHVREMWSVTDHPQVTVCRYGQPVQVDEGMADLIRALWAEVDTVYSCQGGPPPADADPLAYVAFTPEALARFDALVPLQPAHWERDVGASSGLIAVRFSLSDASWLIDMLISQQVAPGE